MAARNKSRRTPARAHYVRARRRGAEPSVLARRAVTIGLLLVVAAGGLYALKQGFGWVGRKLYSENPRFEIQHLVVSCDGRLREDYIREMGALREGLNLFAVDFKELERRLLDVSEIESVYLERKLPNTLVVRVVERVPVAQIVGSQETRYPFLVDRFGYVMPHRRTAATLPLIKGLDTELRLGMKAEHPDVETAIRIVAMCDSTGYLRSYVHIESLDVKYADFIDMRLRGSIRVRMPRFALKTKLQNLATVIKIANGQGQRVKEVDLTLDSAKVPVTYY